MALQPDLEKLYPSLEGFSGATKALFEKFHESQDAFKLTNAIVEVAVAGIRLEGLRSDIVGRYFEEITGFYVRSILESNKRFILSPSETNWLYRQFNPRAHSCFTYDLIQHIVGVTIPDGLIFQKGRSYLQLAGVCEYTIENDAVRSTRKLAQSEFYQDSKSIATDLGMYEDDRSTNNSVYGKKLKGLLRTIRSDIPDLPISLANSWEIIYAMPAKSDQTKDRLYLPFNRTQFATYITRLINQLTMEYQPLVLFD